MQVKIETCYLQVTTLANTQLKEESESLQRENYGAAAIVNGSWLREHVKLIKFNRVFL